MYFFELFNISFGQSWGKFDFFLTWLILFNISQCFVIEMSASPIWSLDEILYVRVSFDITGNSFYIYYPEIKTIIKLAQNNRNWPRQGQVFLPFATMTAWRRRLVPHLTRKSSDDLLRDTPSSPATSVQPEGALWPGGVARPLSNVGFSWLWMMNLEWCGGKNQLFTPLEGWHWCHIERVFL